MRVCVCVCFVWQDIAQCRVGNVFPSKNRLVCVDDATTTQHHRCGSRSILYLVVLESPHPGWMPCFANAVIYIYMCVFSKAMPVQAYVMSGMICRDDMRALDTCAACS